MRIKRKIPAAMICVFLLCLPNLFLPPTFSPQSFYNHSRNSSETRPAASNRFIRNRSKDSQLVEGGIKTWTGPAAGDMLYEDKAKQKLNHGLRAASLRHTSSEPKVKIHFLFLIGDRFNNVDIWDWFFEQAPAGYCSAWGHCKNETPCRASVDKIPWIRIVPHVKSSYCIDVVSPAVALFRAAVRAIPASQKRMHKFVLLCGKSLPVRPWSELYAALTMRQESDFCFVRPVNWPARAYEIKHQKLFGSAKATADHMSWLVKHSQFVILNYEDAFHFVERWESSRLHLELPRFRVRFRHSQSSDVLFPDTQFWFPKRPMNLCPDEYAMFAVVFGAFTNKAFEKACPVNRRKRCNDVSSLYAESQCPVLNVKNHSILSSIAQLDGSVKLSRTRGAQITSLGPASLRLLRNSSFVFVRKVISNAVSRDIYVEAMRERSETFNYRSKRGGKSRSQYSSR